MGEKTDVEHSFTSEQSASISPRSPLPVIHVHKRLNIARYSSSDASTFVHISDRPYSLQNCANVFIKLEGLSFQKVLD
jgi:hypothetical protein